MMGSESPMAADTQRRDTDWYHLSENLEKVGVNATLKSGESLFVKGNVDATHCSV